MPSPLVFPLQRSPSQREQKLHNYSFWWKSQLTHAVEETIRGNGGTVFAFVLSELHAVRLGKEE